MQERITLLRDSAECESPTPDYEAIERSPFIEALKKYEYTLRKLVSMNNQSRIEDRCLVLAQKLTKEIGKFEKVCVQLSGKTADEVSHLEGIVKALEEQNQLLRAAVQPLVDRTLETFNSEARDVMGARIVAQFSDARDRTAIRETRARVGEIEDLFAEANHLYVDGLKELKRCKFHERALLKLYAEQFRSDDQPRRLAVENQLLDEYEAVLQEYLESSEPLDLDEIEASFERFAAGFKESSEQRRRAMEGLREPEDHRLFVEIDQTKIEISRTRELLEQYDTEIGELEVELGALREENLDVVDLETEPEEQDDQEVVNANYESMLAVLKEMLICPICKKRKRDTIIVSCGHPFCRRCIDNCEVARSCPFCLKSYVLTALKPFLDR
jgi:HAMP domain-containing protein